MGLIGWLLMPQPGLPDATEVDWLTGLLLGPVSAHAKSGARPASTYARKIGRILPAWLTECNLDTT
jgi:hypothetical protein